MFFITEANKVFSGFTKYLLGLNMAVKFSLSPREYYLALMKGIVQLNSTGLERFHASDSDGWTYVKQSHNVPSGDLVSFRSRTSIVTLGFASLIQMRALLGKKSFKLFQRN